MPTVREQLTVFTQAVLIVPDSDMVQADSANLYLTVIRSAIVVLYVSLLRLIEEILHE